MLQFLTDFQLKTLLNVTPFRLAGSDVQSLFNPPPSHIKHSWGDMPGETVHIPSNCHDNDLVCRRCSKQKMTAYDIYNLDQYYVGDEWNSIWTNLHAMRETGYSEFSRCIEVDFHLLTALDFSDWNKGKGKFEYELMKSKRFGWCPANDS